MYKSDFIYIILNASKLSAIMFQITFVRIKCQNMDEIIIYVCVQGGWSALMWAAYKGRVEVARLLLEKGANPNITRQYSVYPIIWAAGRGHAEIVQLLLQHGAKVNCSDKVPYHSHLKELRTHHIKMIKKVPPKISISNESCAFGLSIHQTSCRKRKGDTALHIAIRGRSLKLAELLLRNPKDGHLLYRPSKEGETPYNIDCTHQKSTLTQIFGAKHLSPSECDSDMLGYDLYCSALADILSEPTMQPPICVGLYAQWGSGKSFLLKKLEDEMKTLAGQQVEPLFQFSWMVVVLTLLLCGSVALVLGLAVDTKLAIAVTLSLLLCFCMVCAVLVYFGGRKAGESWSWAWVLSTRLARHIGYLELLLKLMFVNPPELPEQTTKALFLFTDYNRLSSVGGETSMAEMIATLSDACEREFDFLATRLFMVFKNDETQGVGNILLFCLQVRVLFSKGPFISIFASDPHIIIKAINQNLDSVLRDSNINGHDYMRNIIYLLVFLNSRGLSSTKRLCISTPANVDQLNSDVWQEDMNRKLSQNSFGEQGSKTALNRWDTYRRRQMQPTVTRQMSFDLTKLLVTEDWFTDISPQTMRRLLNIVSVTGRLLRWPYRTSWIIVFLEETDGVSDQVTLKTIYMRGQISKNIPTTKDVEPLLEIDGDIRSFEVFLSSHTPVLTARDVEICTREDAPWGSQLSHTAPTRCFGTVHSTFGQHSLACSPTGSFPPAGVLPAAQPHSSYFSGLTGPQHPFYNRGSDSVVSSGSQVLLSSLSIDGICEKLKQIQGLDSSMLEQYISTIKKANMNGRVLSQCNLDELKKEMNMNFGDWHLFRSMVRHQLTCELFFPTHSDQIMVIFLFVVCNFYGHSAISHKCHSKTCDLFIYFLALYPSCLK
uniref:Kinase D interacting substrate 220 n=1 Tax=Sinocyclocheilus grahami TaxID=75366 RepID=A0A672LST3_SINGR